MPNKGKISFNIPFTEIIGRCLIASFKEQIGEIILPENPSVGVHLLNNGEKALFSLTSVFLQKQQRKVTTLISMSIFQQPSGYLILDHVHPINPNWIPDKLLTIIKQNQKEIQECIVYKNVNSCYMSHLLKEIRALEKTTNWARFTVVTYDNPNSALKVYGPKISFDNIRSFCKNEIEKQKKADLNFETKILLSNTNSIATFTSGLNFLKIEPASKSKFRFIVNPEIKTKDDFIKWLCEKALINENDIKYCTFFKKPDKDKAFAIVGFSDEEVIKNVKSATNVSKELSKSEDRSNTIRWKILNPNIKKDYIENFLKTLQHPPIKIYQKKPVFFNILINDLPDKFCNVPDLKNFIGNYYFSRLVSEIFISKYKDQKLFAYLKFKTSEERKLAFQEIEKSSFRSDLMVINGGSIRSQIREEQSDRKKICYNLTFSNSEAVSTFCKISQNIASSYEGFADLRIERPYLFPLEEYSKSISEKYNVKFKIPQIKNNQEFCFITLTGPTPKQVGQAANQFMKTLTSMNVRLSTRQSQTLIKDINDVDLLDQWDKQFGVEHKLSEDKKTGSYYKLEIFGNQISQGAFMAEILNYSNDFNQRYHTVALPNNMNFLFKKDRIGSNYLKKLNQEINKKGVISYVHKENIIEIYVKPKQSKLIPELTQKITEFFKTHSYLDKNEIEEQTNTSCVFCAKEEGQSFAICGHNFCPSCLKDQANTSSNSGKLVECSKCQTPVSIRDLRLSFSEEELASLAQTIVQYRCIHEAKFPIAFCPIESCLSLREKSFGYSICASCGTPSCPLCGEQNKPLHLEKTCEQLRKEEKEASEFDLTSIFDKAKNFVNKKWDFVHLGKVLRIDINPGLALGCPSIQKFYKALQKIGLTKIEKSFFGWHGTSTQQALVEICHNGFDPNRRSGQAYGPGEYFGQTSVVSHSYARSSSRMIVTLILNVPESSSHGNFCYVVNNPKNSDLAYNLPVLVVTYEKDNGIINFIQEKPASLFYKLSCSNQKTDEEDNRRWIPAFRWAWKMDDGSYKYYSDYINALIENYYTLFINNQASCTFLTPPIVRFVDDIPQEYFIDFDINTNKYTQKNKKTNYIRKITRIKIDLVQNNVKWQFQNENGQWQNFESLVKDCIEDAFRLYFDKNGSPNFRGLKFPGRPETYTIDFVQGIQINENTKVERIIRRIE